MSIRMEIFNFVTNKIKELHENANENANELHDIFSEKPNTYKPSTSYKIYIIPSMEPTLSQWTTYGDHIYRGRLEIAEVIFFNKSKGIRKIIVDNNGVIINFPGIAEPEKVRQFIESDTIYPVVRFETHFKKVPDDRIMMIWEVQPDGRYWDDDGFGGDNSIEVCLYTYIDSNGNFTGPFRLYSINGQEEKID